MLPSLKIKSHKGQRYIGKKHPPFVVAELSGNHHKSFQQACRLIDAAARAGVDAVKLQTYTPDTITINSSKSYFKIKGKGPWAGRNLYELYGEAYTPWEWQPKLKAYAERKGLILFSTPFDVTSVDFLEKMRVPLYKVASYEIVDIPLLRKIAKTRKPVILSRGMATKAEIRLAISTLRRNGTRQIAVLHCINSYPATSDEMNLASIPEIEKIFNVISGLSDHSLGYTAACAATALGGSIIEKHLILNRSEGGPDAKFSIEPQEFADLVKAVRETSRAIGKPQLFPGSKEENNIQFRKSLFIVESVKRGEKFTERNVRSIRPGQGLPPRLYDSVIGKKAATDIEAGTPVSLKLIR